MFTLNSDGGMTVVLRRVLAPEVVGRFGVSGSVGHESTTILHSFAVRRDILESFKETVQHERSSEHTIHQTATLGPTYRGGRQTGPTELGAPPSGRSRWGAVYPRSARNNERGGARQKRVPGSTRENSDV